LGNIKNGTDSNSKQKESRVLEMDFLARTIVHTSNERHVMDVILIHNVKEIGAPSLRGGGGKLVKL
jgi:hypothetical protein